MVCGSPFICTLALGPTNARAGPVCEDLGEEAGACSKALKQQNVWHVGGAERPAWLQPGK